jgi:hypothetical protein
MQLRVAVHDLPDAEGALRRLRQEAQRLASRHLALTGGRLDMRKDAALGYEAHIELLFPQRQLIVNAAAPAPETALNDALAKASRACAGNPIPSK